jgi:hypothetical protein
MDLKLTFKTLLEIIGFSLSTITYAIKSIGNYNKLKFKDGILSHKDPPISKMCQVQKNHGLKPSLRKRKR